MFTPKRGTDRDLFLLVLCKKNGYCQVRLGLIDGETHGVYTYTSTRSVLILLNGTYGFLGGTANPDKDLHREETFEESHMSNRLI